MFSRSLTSVPAFVLHCIKPFKWQVTGIMLISAFWAVNVSLRPYLLKLILDQATSATTAHDFYYLAFWIILYVMRSNFHSVVFCLYDLLYIRFDSAVKKHTTLLLMDHLSQHSAHYYQHHFAGNLMNKIRNVFRGVPDIIINIDRFIGHGLSCVFAIYTASTVSGYIALCMAIWIVIFLCVSVSLAIYSSKKATKAASLHSHVAGNIVDVLSNIASVRLFCGYQTERHYLERSTEKAAEGDRDRDWAFAKINIFQRISFAIFQMICFWLLFNGLVSKTITPGQFALIATLNLSIIDSLWYFSQDARRCAQDVSNVKEGIGLIMLPHDMQEDTTASALMVTEGKIVFDRVSFNFPGVSPLFNQKSIVIEPKQKVGLVGYSGSGKSTFVNLVLRTFDIQSGTISIDGQDISTVSQKSLRDHIAMIPQETVLFHRTVIDNIRYSKPDATLEEVMAAAKQADAHTFISKMDQGYESEVGEHGSKLSGGQRQRIAIARAILKDAPIVIIDEGTSHLDPVTEARIQTSLKTVLKDKTALVIAHRLSTLADMDRILVFDKGRIVQDGTHAQLVEQDGLYKVLWNTQANGFLGTAQTEL